MHEARSDGGSAGEHGPPSAPVQGHAGTAAPWPRLQPHRTHRRHLTHTLPPHHPRQAFSKLLELGVPFEKRDFNTSPSSPKPMA